MEVEVTGNDAETRSLCLAYWQTDQTGERFAFRLSELSIRFGISTSKIQRIVSAWSRAVSSDCKCSMCGEYRSFHNRTQFVDRHWASRSWTCSDCKTEADRQSKISWLRLEESKRESVRKRFPVQPRDPETWLTLTTDDVVLIVSLLRASSSAALNSISSLKKLSVPLSPTNAMDCEILKRLFERKLICVDPELSPIEAFDFRSGEIDQFFVDSVCWRLPTDEKSLPAKDLIEILEAELEMKKNEQDASLLLELWRKIAVQESIQYFLLSLADHNLPAPNSDKPALVFSKLIENYSVAQMYNLIWRATKDAAAFYLRGGTSPQHASNVAVISILRYGERAATEGWAIKPYRRDFRCEQSMVSHVLFNTLLRIGDQGFEHVPQLHLIYRQADEDPRVESYREPKR